MNDTAVTILQGRLDANLIASGARAARWPGGQCAVCQRPIGPGHRVADLATGRGTVHVADCAARAARLPRRRP